MKKAEKDIRDFYKTHSAMELKAVIEKDECSLKYHFRSVREKVGQDYVECRIAILRDMLESIED